MKNEQEKLTITELIGKIASFGPCHGYRTHLEYYNGKLTFIATEYTVKSADVTIGDKSISVTVEDRTN